MDVMKEYKYYGTNISLYGEYNKKIHELGFKGYHNQFRIVCKAYSMAEANRIVADLGICDKAFNKDFTSETRNKKEIELCNKGSGVIIAVDGTSGFNYVDIREIVGELATTKDLIKYAIEYLLEADLREENGYTKDIIKKLEKIKNNDFEIKFK